MDLRIGILAEGRTDLVVLRNILYAFEIDKSQVQFIRPELSMDESDRHAFNTPLAAKEFGSWTHVQRDCEQGEPIADFLDNQLAGEKRIIIQLDSDTCSEYGVQEVLNPREDADFWLLRNRIIQKIQAWVGAHHLDQLLYAVCIRQMDAWVLALFANPQDKQTDKIALPKEVLHGNPAYKKLRGKKEKEKYESLSDGFSKKKKLKEARRHNHSLDFFIASLEQAVLELQAQPLKAE